MINTLLVWRPSGWIDYLLIYASPGIFMTAYFLISTWKDRPSEFVKGISKVIDKEMGLVDCLKEVLVYCFAISCVLVGWPAFLIWLPFHWRQEKQNKAWQALPDFDCAPEYLVRQITPDEAEAQSIVHDPLGFAPAIAFGHLHEGWKAFIARIEPDEELWSFLVPAGGKTGKYQLEADREITGFARIKKGAVIEEFLY